MNVKTSITDPIEVAEVIAPHHPGKIGISLCPGKKGPSSFGGVWDRDLATDLSVIKRDFGATAVVTLMTDLELSTSKVTGLGQAVRDHGMQWFHLPIEEMTSPGESLDEQWAEALSYVLDAITKGHNILVHCRGGLRVSRPQVRRRGYQNYEEGNRAGQEYRGGPIHRRNSLQQIPHPNQ